MAVLLSLTIGNSVLAADWVEIGETDNATLFFDTESIERGGDAVNSRIFWSMTSYTVDQRDVSMEKYRSTISQYEIDCDRKKVRSMHIVMYTGINGQGDVLASDAGKGLWRSIVPGSVGEQNWKIVCKGASIAGRSASSGFQANTYRDSAPQTLPPKPRVKVSPEFTRAYNRALFAMGDKASTLKADQQQWWKKREVTCGSLPEYLYMACMEKEENDRTKFLNEMEKAFSDVNQKNSL
jgi:hypothetical protein